MLLFALQKSLKKLPSDSTPAPKITLVEKLPTDEPTAADSTTPKPIAKKPKKAKEPISCVLLTQVTCSTKRLSRNPVSSACKNWRETAKLKMPVTCWAAEKIRLVEPQM